MSINPKCHRCGSELKEFGAILLSPPSGKSVDKFHICTECYLIITKEIEKFQDLFRKKQIFLELAHRCFYETRRKSNPMDLINHPAYQTIIGMGKDVVPFILEDLQNSPKWWFYALIKINGGDIIPQDQHEEYVGQLNKLTKAWLEWGRNNKYI